MLTANYIEFSKLEVESPSTLKEFDSAVAEVGDAAHYSDLVLILLTPKFIRLGFKLKKIRRNLLILKSSIDKANIQTPAQYKELRNLYDKFKKSDNDWNLLSDFSFRFSPNFTIKQFKKTIKTYRLTSDSFKRKFEKYNSPRYLPNEETNHVMFISENKLWEVRVQVYDYWI